MKYGLLCVQFPPCEIPANQIKFKDPKRGNAFASFIPHMNHVVTHYDALSEQQRLVNAAKRAEERQSEKKYALCLLRLFCESCLCISSKSCFSRILPTALLDLNISAFYCRCVIHLCRERIMKERQIEKLKAKQGPKRRRKKLNQGWCMLMSCSINSYESN